MHIDRIEAGTVECGCHLNLTIDTLLPQNRNFWTGSLVDIRGSHVVVDVVREFGVETGILCVKQIIEFFTSAVGVIPERLNTVTGLGPQALELHPGFIHHSATFEGQAKVVSIIRATDNTDVIPKTRGRELLQDKTGVFPAYLDDGTQLFIKKFPGKLTAILGEAIQLDINPTVAGETHFSKGDEQAAV